MQGQERRKPLMAVVDLTGRPDGDCLHLAEALPGFEHPPGLRPRAETWVITPGVKFAQRDLAIGPCDRCHPKAAGLIVKIAALRSSIFPCFSTYSISACLRRFSD